MPDIFDQIELSQETPTSDIFDQIDYISPKQEIQRHVSRSFARAGETLMGLPGDILTLPKKLISSGVSRISEIPEEKISRKFKGFGPPSSQEIRKITENVFGDIITPQNEKEKLSDDIISDAVALAVPIKGKIPFLRSIGTSILGNLAEKGVEKLGFDEKGQAAAKIGSFFLAGLTGKGNVKKYWNKQYDLAEKNIQKNSILDANKLQRGLDKLEMELKKGGIETPSQKFVQKPLQELRKSIDYGELKVEDAIAAKKKINELRASLFDEVKGEAARKGARTKINKIASLLDESLEKYGKENPKFFEHWKNANEAYAGFQQSRRVGKWVSRILPFSKLGKGSLLIAEALFKPASLPYTVAGYGAFKGAELATRMFKNPTLRRYYANLMKNAVNENKTGVLRSLSQMEKELKKTDPNIFDELTREQDAE